MFSIMHWHRSCNWFVLLLKKLLEHTQIKGQYLNCDFKKQPLQYVLFDGMYVSSLASAFKFVGGFYQIALI